MPANNPHYLLYSEAGRIAGMPPQWRFVLQPIGRDQVLVAADSEPETTGNRLELLAVVRGLEALDEPSQVTLITRSRYVSRGIRRGLSQWRDRQWRWERFGQLVPIRDLDLWQRVDRALEFHQVECCPSPFDDDDASGEDFDAVPDLNHVRSLTAAEASSAQLNQSRESWSEPPIGRPAFRRRTSRRIRQGRISRTFARLRQGVLAPLAAFWRPAFTRAA